MKKNKPNYLKPFSLTDTHYRMLIYLLMGALTTLLNLFIFWIAVNLFKMPYLVATSLAWLLAVLFAYFTNKHWVFKSHTTSTASLIAELFHFIGWRLLSLLIDLIVMFLLVALIKLSPLLAKFISNLIVVIVNYFASKWFIFRS